MIIRFLLMLPLLAFLTACGTTGGLLVSNEARHIGGNLFIESTENGAKFLVLDGEITAETSFAFQSFVEQVDVDGLVIAQSPGGDLLAAHQIGRALNSERMNTVVMVNCISACVDIFITGRKREMTDIAELGLHAATNRDVAYDIDRKYWGRFGFSKVNEAAYKVSNKDLWIIDARRAKQLRLATAIIKTNE